MKDRLIRGCWGRVHTRRTTWRIIKWVWRQPAVVSSADWKTHHRRRTALAAKNNGESAFAGAALIEFCSKLNSRARRPQLTGCWCQALGSTSPRHFCGRLDVVSAPLQHRLKSSAPGVKGRPRAPNRIVATGFGQRRKWDHFVAGNKISSSADPCGPDDDQAMGIKCVYIGHYTKWLNHSQALGAALIWKETSYRAKLSTSYVMLSIHY